MGTRSRIVRGKRAAAAAAMAAAALSTAGATAHAATATYPAGTSTFDADQQGWVASGEACSALSGTLLCTADAAYDAAAGNPGGALSTNVNVTLNVAGFLSGTSIWTSPQFDVPAGAPVTAVSLQLDQAFASGGLLNLGPSSTVKVVLEDLTTTGTTDLLSTSLDDADAAYETTKVHLAAATVVAGHSYRLRVETTATSTQSSIGLLGTARTLVDNVGLAVTREAAGGPGGSGAPGAPAGLFGPAGPSGAGGLDGSGGGDDPLGSAGVRTLRGPLTDVDIASLTGTLNLNAERGVGPDGSLVALSQCTVVGTSGDDRIVGSSRNDVICGLGGDDAIDGAGGRDVIDGANGNDRLTGGAGGDVLLGLAGNDRLVGGAGADGLGGGSGGDSLLGGSGADRLSGRSGNDRLLGEAGGDRLAGGAGRDRLGGGAGADRLAGGAEGDRLTGGRGRDRMIGGRGGDRLGARDRHRDVVDGGAGADRATIDVAQAGTRGVRGLRVADVVSGVERVR